MGYRRKSKTYRIIWDEGEYEGLEIRMKSLSVGEMLELGSATEGGVYENLVKPFTDHLISWNLEDENGKPVPATSKGVGEQDMDLVVAAAMKWMSAMTDVQPDLKETSPSGEISLEDELNLESLSKSLVS